MYDFSQWHAVVNRMHLIVFVRLEAMLAQLVKKMVDWRSKNSKFRLHAGGVFFWYSPLVSLSIIASMASEHHDQNNGSPNQWIISVKIIPAGVKEFRQVTCK